MSSNVANSTADAGQAESVAGHEPVVRFFENVSHELRGPLAVLKEFTAIMLEGLAGEVPPKPREYLGVIAESVDELESRVNDLLDLGRLDAAMIGSCRRPCRIQDIVESVRPRLEKKAALHHARFETRMAPDLPDLFCDPAQIARVVGNLAGHAFRRSGDGGTVRLRVRRMDGDESTILCDVEDSGARVSAEKLHYLQDRLRSGAAGGPAALTELDLGLSLAVRFIELNLGEVSVSARRGGGLAISFSLAAADPISLVPRFFYQSSRTRGASTHASVQVVRIDGTAEPAELEEVGAFLQHHLRRWDMIMPLRPGAWLLVLPCASHSEGAMVRRLESAWREINAQRFRRELPRLSFDGRGCWAIESQGGRLLAALQGCIKDYSAP